MKITKILVHASLLLSLNTYASDGSVHGVADEILKNQFPSYRLAIERDFQTEVIFGEWGKNAKISFAPQTGDFNKDSIADLVFFALEKNATKIITVDGKNYNTKQTVLLVCHGSNKSRYNCFKIIDKYMPHPLWWFYSVSTIPKTKCPYEKNLFIEGQVVYVTPALGNSDTVYWFNGMEYHSCSFGD